MNDSGLYQLREAGLLCDTILKCATDGKEVLAHKAVLAGHSSYFKALFCGAWTSNREGNIDIQLEHVTGDTLLCWVRAMYRSGTSRLLELESGMRQAQNEGRPHAETVRGLYQLCSFYDTPDVLFWFEKVMYCTDGLIGRNGEVAVSLLAMMGDREETAINKDKLIGLAACNLAQLVCSESSSLLQQLSSDTLQMILRHETNKTALGRGMHNVEAIRIWLEGDPEGRQAELVDLLNSLPMSYSYLFEQLVQACEACQRSGSGVSLHAFNAATSAVGRIVQEERIQCQSPPAHTSMKGLLVFGGRLDVWMGVRECELYDTRRDVWVPAPNLPSEATKVKGTSVPGGAFSFGACAEVFRSASSQWVRGRADPGGASLLIDASSASLGSDVFVIGGRVGCSHSSYMATYSLEQDRWRGLAGCGEERQNQGFAALGGKLYCVGGQAKKVLTSVEAYQPELDHWQTLKYAQLASAVKYPSLVAHDGRLFCIGGRNSERRILSSVEAMDPREGFWSTLPPMLEARSSCGAASVGTDLFVAGGTSARNEELLTSVECYSSTAGKWFARAPMSMQRACHTLAAVCVCACVQV